MELYLKAYKLTTLVLLLLGFGLCFPNSFMCINSTSSLSACCTSNVFVYVISFIPLPLICPALLPAVPPKPRLPFPYPYFAWYAWLEPLVVPMILGNMRTRITRSVGRQAQIMPTLTSMFDQFTTSTWSQVGFEEAAKVTRDWRRRHDTTVTLEDISSEPNLA